MPQIRKPAGKKIEREDARAWWCPFDDHSNMQTTMVCGGCGSERDGDTVRPNPTVAAAIADTEEA